MILIVEDDTDLREMLCMALEAEGYAVTGVTNGRAAIDTLRQLRDPASVCLIVLDMMMPVMSGHECLAQLRSEPRWSAIPVVTMSARWDIDRPEDCPFLCKPVKLDTLLSRAQQHCRSIGKSDSGGSRVAIEKRSAVAS